MGCSACMKRNSGGGRIIPVNPNAGRNADKRQADRSAIAQGNTLRQKLRYTGR